MRLTPDNFPIVMENDLRELWRRYSDDNVRRLILEVHRARKVHHLCHAEAQKAIYAGQGGRHGESVAEVQRVVDRLCNEFVRLGSVGGIPVQVPILP